MWNTDAHFGGTWYEGMELSEVWYRCAVFGAICYGEVRCLKCYFFFVLFYVRDEGDRSAEDCGSLAMFL